MSSLFGHRHYIFHEKYEILELFCVKIFILFETIPIWGCIWNCSIWGCIWGCNNACWWKVAKVCEAEYEASGIVTTGCWVVNVSSGNFIGRKILDSSKTAFK